ncbi:MAG: DJ-1/PfpI family protein [Spirochaetaceae bacterium]|jgi:4-methyl-5(b-hydroxyethyl)-thiazole monophosphate biosynthesis|nr:DJ-1/PfpI family protein [Spirochaetaceae bacterium]
MKNVVIFFADGFEEVEAVTPLDYLRRADVQAVSVSCGSGKEVTGAHGIGVICDLTVREALARFPSGADAVVCPGGMPGASNIASSKDAVSLILKTRDSGGITAAICASPIVVFSRLGLLTGKTFTCYPGMEGDVEFWAGPGYEALMAASTKTNRAVETDGRLITGQGPGAAEEFALALIAAVGGPAAADTVQRAACLRPPR